MGPLSGWRWVEEKCVFHASWQCTHTYTHTHTHTHTQERQKVIGPNTVAYLNVDSAVAGTSCLIATFIHVLNSFPGSTLLSVAANPLLYKPLYTAAKLVCCNMWVHCVRARSSSIQVRCPDPSFDTLYDQWLYYRSMYFNGTVQPAYVCHLL